MEILIWTGAGLTLLGLAGLIWCIVLAARARSAGLSDEALRARLQKVVALNLGRAGAVGPGSDGGDRRDLPRLGAHRGCGVGAQRPIWTAPRTGPIWSRRFLLRQIIPCRSDPSCPRSAAIPTMEGAGVKLHRAFGFEDPTMLDPFLLFDDFRNDRPQDYLRGFPWHPHRGIETITYVLDGTVEHADSLGNHGTLGAGSVQWMTAGSGILHQEMPKGSPAGPDARLPALGQPALVAEDDRAALSGHRGRRHPRGDRRRWHAGEGRSRASSGASAVRSTASPPTRSTSTSPFPRV